MRKELLENKGEKRLQRQVVTGNMNPESVEAKLDLIIFRKHKGTKVVDVKKIIKRL